MKFKLTLHEILKTIQVIETKSSWKLDELIQKLNFSKDHLIYILTLISDIYTIDGNLFFDYELDLENNILNFEFSEEATYINILNDAELLNLFILMSFDKNYKKLVIEDFNIQKFYEKLNNIFKQFDLGNLELNNLQNINFDNSTYIEYIKQGSTERNIYNIKPQVLKTNNDGIILEAYDILDKREKTFLVNRILNVYEKVDGEIKYRNNSKNYILEFKSKNQMVLDYLDNEYVIKKGNNFKFNFYSKNNALEFCLKFIKDIEILSPKEIIDEINYRKIKLIESLTHELN